MKTKPKFDDIISPEAIINEIHELNKANDPISHSEILQKLIDQLDTIDFVAIAFPKAVEIRQRISDIESSCNISIIGNDNVLSEEYKELKKKLRAYKLTRNHLLIISIEYIIKVANENQWGLRKTNDNIYVYNGCFWSILDKEVLQKFLGEASEKIGVVKFTARYYQFREQLLKQFVCSEIYPITQRNSDIVLVNLLNGTFEISTLGNKLRQFDSMDFLTYQLPFKYDPNAVAPIFTNYLNKVLPDIERQMVLAEFLGFVFIKNGSKTIKEEKALLLYGTGANGKSVFFEIVNALLGRDNVCSHQLSMITSPKDGESYRAKLSDKLVNYASEINGNLETSIFKQMVSGEPISARMLYGQPFEMVHYAKLIFNCNELPKDVEYTNAYFRRFLIIPFDVTIPEHEQDKKLHIKIIENELSGVFNWVLAGLKRLLAQQRFSNCEAANKALEQYKLESNSIKLFLDESFYKISADDYERIGNLYSEYKSFCINDGMHPFKKINFSKQLQSLGFRLGRESGTGQKIAFLKKDNELF